MTIAACYVCSEGVVFGADSTWTVPVECAGGDVRERYFNYGQKIFEVGKDSTRGVVFWGLLTLNQLSCRTLVARLADDLQPTDTVEDAARGLADGFWSEYTECYKENRARLVALTEKGDECSEDEQAELEDLKAEYRGGFCLGGYVRARRLPQAFEVSYDLTSTGQVPPSRFRLEALKRGAVRI
jgi:hypothetical protein